MTIPDKHQLKIAKQAMAFHCAGLVVLGGPTHYEASSIIEKLTEISCEVPQDCTCDKGDTK